MRIATRVLAWLFGVPAALLLLIYLVLLVKTRLTPATAVGYALTLMLFLTPYTWSYDQLLLLIPIVTLLLDRSGGRYPAIRAAIFFLSLDLLALLLFLLALHFQQELWNAGLPLVVLVFIVWHAAKNWKESKTFVSS